MFCSKQDTKKRSAWPVLAVGALAAIGVISITRCGKKMANEAICKMKTLFSREHEITLLDDEGDV